MSALYGKGLLSACLTAVLILPVAAQTPEGTDKRLELVRVTHGEQVLSVRFSPDGRLLATAGQGRVIRLWDAATGKPLVQVEGSPGQVWCIRFSPDSKLLASVSEGRTIHLWDTTTGREVRQLVGHQGPVWAVAFSPDGKYMASASEDGSVRLWDAASGQELRQMIGHHGGVWPVTFSPDSKLVASGGKDGTIRLWETATGREIRKIEAHQGAIWPVTFSPDGKIIASGGWQDRTLRLWEVATGRERRQIVHPGGVKYVAFAPNGKTIATGGEDRTTRLWEVATGRERGQFGGHQNAVMAVAFAPDGKRLTSGSSDTQVLVWDLSARSREEGDPAAPAPSVDLAALWADLAHADAAKAHQAIWTLASMPQQAVPFLRTRLQPVPPIDTQRLARLIRELDDESFLVRQQATAQLAHMDELAESALRQTLDGQPSLEVVRRVGWLLEKLEKAVPSPNQLRGLRAIEALEHMSTPEARQILEALAGGNPDARLTQEARSTLQRMR